MKLHRVLVPMTDEERAALVNAAQQSMRDPRDHARYILRRVLLGDRNNIPGQTKSKTAEAYQGAAVLQSVNP